MPTENPDNASEQARLLSNALPYMQRYEDKTVVVKYGGHAMGDIALGRAFARDIALLKQSGVNPIVVHGGGPQIGAMLARMGIESKFEGGLRVTDQKTVEIVEMVLAGSINKEIVALINAEGEWAIGLCGKDGTYNINADTFAGAIAGALQASRLLFLTDVPGVLDADRKLIPRLSVAQARDLIADGTISGGMIPKVETCIDAIERGVEGVVILNGKTAHAVLLELFTEHGAGTLIVP